MPTYPTNPALEAAVIANAEDDTPRLAYADWLDENGDPDRAAFIRTQVALWDKHPADEDYVDLRERRVEAEAQLLNYVSDGRLKPKFDEQLVSFGGSGFASPDDPGVPFQRGFPYFGQEPELGERSELDCARQLRERLPDLVRTTTIRAFHFHLYLNGLLTEVLRSPSAAKVSALSITNHNSGHRVPSAVQGIADSPARKSLRWLDLAAVSNRDALALAGGKFPQLIRFSSMGFDCTGAAQKKLLASTALSRLRRVLFWFRSNPGHAVFDQLAEFRELHTLELWNATTEVIAALGKAGSFQSLGRLCITKSAFDRSKTRIGASLATAQMPKLASLELGHPLGNDGMKMLADSGLLDRVKELALFDTEVGDNGLAVIASSTFAHQLRSLSLNTPFGKAGLANLGSPGAFPNLTTLNLYTSGKQKVHESDLASFLRSFAIPAIRHLNLEGWPVGDAGAKAIARNPAFANLRWVRMGGCRIGKAGFRALVESPNLSNVVYLYIRANPCERSADLLCNSSLLPKLTECWVLPSGGPFRERLRKARPHVAWY